MKNALQPIQILSSLLITLSNSFGFATTEPVKDAGSLQQTPAISKQALKLIVNPKVFEQWKGMNKAELKSRIHQLKLNDLGGNSGGGGDDVGMEFQQTFLQALNEIKESSPSLARQIQEANLEEIAKHVEVIAVDGTLDVTAKGLIQNSVAYNNPLLGVIMVNRGRWHQIKQQKLKGAIAVHEVASLAGIEQTGLYSLSAQYAAMQGGAAVDQLKSQLEVNRVQQLKTEAPSARPVDVLQRLFDESNESVSMNDLKTVSSKYDCAAAGKFRFDSWKENNIDWESTKEIFPVQIKVARYKSMDAVPAEPSHGPLFPAKPAIPAKYENGFNMAVSVSMDNQFIGYAEQPNQIYFTNYEENEITQRGCGLGREHCFEDRVRKSNGALVFSRRIDTTPSIIRDGKTAILYGYCYPKSKK